MSDNKDKEKRIIIGIDLGTTNSAVAIYEAGQPKIYENKGGARTTPSVIALKKAKVDKKTNTIVTPEEWIVGDSAKRQSAVNFLNTLYGVKRLIGRRFDDPEVAKMQSLASYKIVKGDNGDAWVEVNGQKYAPAQISAKVLKELKEAVEEKLGVTVSEAVITVPAYFNDAQRKATKDAGTFAGLNVLRVINEPTAAALAYGLDKKLDSKIAVFDLGGGTFDVSVLKVSVDEEIGTTLEVLSTNGDTFLGGENFDEVLTEYLINQINKDSDEHGVEIDLQCKVSKAKHALPIQKVREIAERSKIALSFSQSIDINENFVAHSDTGTPVHLNLTLTRADLEKMLKPLIDRTLEPCKKALADAGLKASDIDEVVLVGGQTRMPLVVETVKKFFNKEPRRDVNPDEIVAMGAATQGGMLTGKLKNVQLLDVIPLSIGIRLHDGTMSIVVPRNSPIPGKFEDTFHTHKDNAPNVNINVFQGERPKASDNRFLGNFLLGSEKERGPDGRRHPDALPLGKGGQVAVLVTMSIDANGVLSVSATNPDTGLAQNIVLTPNGGLSEEDIQRMIKDSEENAEKDKLFRLSLTAAPAADEALKDASLDVEKDENGEYKDKYFKAAPEELLQEFQKVVAELTEARTKNDVQAMADKTAALQDVRARIGQAFTDAAKAVKEEKPAEQTPATDAPAAEGEAKPEAPASDAPKSTPKPPGGI